MSAVSPTNKLITIIDYDAGNILNVLRALRHIGFNAVLASSPEEISKETSIIVIPGVGAFGQGMQNLKDRGFISYLDQWQKESKPLVGICLGMQLLFSESSEMGAHKGLGYLQGRMDKIPLQNKDSKKYPVPHIGWSEIKTKDNNSQGVFYFVHSYYAVQTAESEVISQTMYGDIKIPAIVGKGKTLGFQFHPEKSAENGLELLKSSITNLLST